MAATRALHKPDHTQHQTDRTPLRQEPYLANKYYIEINGIYEAVFGDCSGLEAKTDTQSYNEGGLNFRVHVLPVRTSFTNITLKAGMTESSEMWQWYALTMMGEVIQRNMSIVLVPGSQPQAPRRRWNINGAFPVRWSMAELRVDSNAFVIETIELAHQGFSLA